MRLVPMQWSSQGVQHREFSSVPNSNTCGRSGAVCARARAHVCARARVGGNTIL